MKRKLLYVPYMQTAWHWKVSDEDLPISRPTEVELEPSLIPGLIDLFKSQDNLIVSLKTLGEGTDHYQETYTIEEKAIPMIKNKCTCQPDKSDYIKDQAPVGYQSSVCKDEAAPSPEAEMWTILWRFSEEIDDQAKIIAGIYNKCDNLRNFDEASPAKEKASRGTDICENLRSHLDKLYDNADILRQIEKHLNTLV